MTSPTQEAAQQDGKPSPAAKNDKQEKIDIVVRDQHNGETAFKTKMTMSMSKLIEAWCDRAGKKRPEVRFLFDGRRIQDNDTPQSLRMEDGDSIDVVMEQVGGANAAGRQGLIFKYKLVRFKTSEGKQLSCGIEGDSTFEKMFAKICLLEQIDPKTTTFHCRGKPISPKLTPSSAGINDGDVFYYNDEQISKINVQVRGPYKFPSLAYRINRSSSLRRMMLRYQKDCYRQPATHNFRGRKLDFFYRGRRLTADDTFEKLSIFEGDVIETFLHRSIA